MITSDHTRPKTSKDYEPGKLGHSHDAVKEHGFVHEIGGCRGICVYTGKTFTNSPPGSTMIYAVYQCQQCGGRMGVCTRGGKL